ncbi:MAG TPA: hypothetical protein VFG72_06290 [Marmoricola sp.]|nr:hypothetical protein [Marmoricola sp.]
MKLPALTTPLAALTAGLLWQLAPPAVAATTLHAQLVEQNDSGGRGSVTLTVTDQGDLRVQIRAAGLMPGPHAQHLHGSREGGHFMCASMADDSDGDGWITNEEASGEYGNVFLALTVRGDTSVRSGLDLDRMPVADADGRLRYDRTISADELPDGLVQHLSTLHVVQHGIDANDNGKYDVGALGESTFASNLGIPGVPEEVTDPAACGVVTGAGAGHQPHGAVATGSSGADVTGTVGWAAAGMALIGIALGVGLSPQVRRRRSDETASSAQR